MRNYYLYCIMEKTTMEINMTTIDFTDYTPAKLEKEAKICWKLTQQEEHNQNFLQENLRTYADSVWMRMVDKNYYKTKSFDKFLTIVDSSYCYQGVDRWAKACILTDYTMNFKNYCVNNLPYGFFVNTNDKKEKLLKKLGKTVSVVPLRPDFKEFIADVKADKYKLSQTDKEALLWLSLYCDDSGTLFTGWRIAGERKTYFSPNLQGLKRKLRDLVLAETNYADLDAVKSYHYDFEYLLGKYGETLTQKEKRILKRLGGVDARENISNLVPLKGGQVKTAALAILMGGTKLLDGMDKKTLQEFTAARQKFTKILAGEDEFQNLQGFEKTVQEDWEYEDYGFAMSRILNRLETKKMESYSLILQGLGYKTLHFMYDGLIVDKKPSDTELQAVSRLFMETNWNSPLKLEKVWS